VSPKHRSSRCRAQQISPEDAKRLGEQLAEAASGQGPRGAKANLELFRKHEAQIRQYAMSGLAILGL